MPYRIFRNLYRILLKTVNQETSPTRQTNSSPSVQEFEEAGKQRIKNQLSSPRKLFQVPVFSAVK